MSKNILIFSDGTGQAGGLRPDQRLSNVYKMYRASRVGPDNAIDPRIQIAFYDPGLGSEQASSDGIGILTAVRKFASSALGVGIGRNIVDCYEAILKHYEPGDRIYLIGFSRGAYTVRCVAGVLRLCGVPTRLPSGERMPRFGSALRAVAEEAVHEVYEHGSGRKRSHFEAERQELARRFRKKYSSGDDTSANVAPYFVGVFDTVAALGATGLRRVLMLAMLAFAGLFAMLLTAHILAWLIGWETQSLFIGLATICLGIAAWKTVSARLKIIRDYPKKGSFKAHWTGWRFGNYDTIFDSAVMFGRHALAIDERRNDFKRVKWGQPSEGNLPLTPEGLERFVQLWFAGNHSDIGGSYPEDESRLSDIALSWMVGEAESLPCPIIFDHSKLATHPSADGFQHCEVEALLDAYPRWWPKSWRKSWSASPRFEASGAPYHPTVLQRLKMDEIANCTGISAYRPEALSKDPALRHYFEKSSDTSCSK